MAYQQRQKEGKAVLVLQAAGRMHMQRQAYLKLLKLSKYRNEVARELLSTEEYYLNQLRLVVEVFLHPLKKACEQGRPIITESEIRAIFSTIEVIVRINTELLADLKDRIRDWGPNSKIGDVFVKMADCFKIYTNYVQHFSEAIKMVQECTKKSEQFADFCKKGFTDIGDPLASLSSYLITPIQRIPRYQLLLKDLLKHTWPSHPDYSDIELALDMITKTAVHVNEKQKEAENIQKCITVQNSLVGKKVENLLDSSRRFVREGALTEVVMEGKGKTIKMRKRWFFLFSDIVVRCEMPNTRATLKRRASSTSVPAEAAKGLGPQTFEYVGRLLLTKASLVNMGDEGDKKHAFELVTSHDSLWLCADSEEDKDAWMEAINSCIKSSTNRADEIDRHLTQIAEKKASAAKTLIDSKYIALRVHGNNKAEDMEIPTSYHSLNATERYELEQRAAERVKSLSNEEREQNALAKQRGESFKDYMSGRHTISADQFKGHSSAPANSTASSSRNGKKGKEKRRGTISSSSTDTSPSRRSAFKSMKKSKKDKKDKDEQVDEAVSASCPELEFSKEDRRLTRSSGIRSLSIEAIASAEEERIKKEQGSPKPSDPSSQPSADASPRLRKFASLRRESQNGSSPARTPPGSPGDSEMPRRGTVSETTQRPKDTDGDAESGEGDAEGGPKLRKFAKMRRDTYNSLPRPAGSDSTESSPASSPQVSSKEGSRSPRGGSKEETASTSPRGSPSPAAGSSGSAPTATPEEAPKTRRFAQRNNLYKNLSAIS